MDLLSNIAGKTPYTGLITDQGRQANWLVEVATVDLPNPHLLGAAIGEKVQTGVPYIIGLDRFLGPGICEENIDYLQEMGAIIATYSAVDLYHVENLTPEAVEHNHD
jgi:predicted aconitase